MNNKANIEKVSGYGNTWNTKSWSGYTNIGGYDIWSDGDNIYYSNSTNQYVLDKTTSTWSSKTWSGYTNINNGSNIWTDGDNIYYSYRSDQYVLYKSRSTWYTKTWNGLTSFTGDGIWTDGDNIYYSLGSHYVLDKATSTWSPKTWSGYTNIDGLFIWSDGDNIYYSYDSDQYVLDKSTSTWSSKSWSGLTNFNGDRIWTDGDNIYYSYGTNHYVLDKATSTWSPKTWNGLTNFDGDFIWTDGDNIYYSYNSDQYVLEKLNNTIIEDSITIKSNGDIQGAAEILDSAGNALSEKYDANSLAFQNFRVTVPSSGWSSTATDGFYTQTITLPYPINTYKEVDINPTGASDGTDQTSAEAVAYSCLKHFKYTEGTGVTQATLYASTKPTSTFYIMVSGCYMTKNAASSGVAQDITTANKLNVYDANGNKVAEFNGSATVNIYYRSKIVSVPYTGWSSVVDANGYYTQSIDLVDNYNSYDTPDIYLCGSTNDTKATAAEQAAWFLIDRVWMADSTATHTLILYAKTKPTTTFYIRVKGSYIG